MRFIANAFESTTLKAFEMHVLGGRSVTETAWLLGLSKWSIHQAKSRVLKRLTERLAAEDSDGEAWQTRPDVIGGARLATVFSTTQYTVR